MPHTTALQYTDYVMGEEQANQELDGLALQDGYLGGRVLPPSETRQMCGWMIQAFFVDGAPPAGWGPIPGLDNLRRVLILDSQRLTLGIKD